MAAGLLAPVSVAHADVFVDDLTRCLVKSTSSKDQTLFMVWLFGAMSVHPAVKGYSSMTAAQRDAGAKAAGVVMVRLITADCRKESVDAIRAGGAASLSASFRVVGETAMRGFSADPQVAAGMASLAQDLAPSLVGVLKDAGTIGPPAK